MQTLTKPWNKAPAGTEITDDPAEAKKGGKKVVLVDSARLAHLVKHGFFRVKKETAEPGAPVPSVPISVVDLGALAKEGKNVRDPRLDAVVEGKPSVALCLLCGKPWPHEHTPAELAKWVALGGSIGEDGVPVRAEGSGKLKGRPLDEDGAIEFEGGDPNARKGDR